MMNCPKCNEDILSMSVHYCPSKEKADDRLPPATGSALLEWLDNNAAELVVESWPIADTGDYDSAWAVYEETIDGAVSRSKREAMGWGKTPAEAIRDAMKSEDDPTKYNYVPPEFRSQNVDGETPARKESK